jgi:hypothetical protein
MYDDAECIAAPTRGSQQSNTVSYFLFRAIILPTALAQSFAPDKMYRMMLPVHCVTRVQ